MTDRIPLEESIEIEYDPLDSEYYQRFEIVIKLMKRDDEEFGEQLKSQIISDTKNSNLITEKGYKDANELLEALSNSRQETIRLEIKYQHVEENTKKAERLDEEIRKLDEEITSRMKENQDYYGEVRVLNRCKSSLQQIRDGKT